MDDAERATQTRARARAIREQGRRLKARAERMPEGRMREMLTGQAAILVKAADDLEGQALALAPPMGTA
jgi:hypothetical protein